MKGERGARPVYTAAKVQMLKMKRLYVYLLAAARVAAHVLSCAVWFLAYLLLQTGSHRVFSHGYYHARQE